MKGSLQIKNNKYYAVFRFNGKQKWVNLSISAVKGNKKHAEKAMYKVLIEYSELETEPAAANMLFLDFLDLWLEEIKPIVKPSTWEGYKKNINGKIKPYLKGAKYKLNELRGMYFTKYFAYLKENGRSDGKGGLGEKSIENIKGVLSSALKFAVQNDLIENNVIERSRMPIFENQKEFVPVVYDVEEIKSLLAYAEETESKACLFLFLDLFTGARKGELMGLTWENVDFDNNTIHICKNRTGSKKEVLSKLTTPKTRNGIRTVTLPKKVMDLLMVEKIRQEQNKQKLGKSYIEYEYNYVIRKEDGSTYNPNSINRIIKKMTEKIGLPHCRVHDYRHAVATLLFENNVPLVDVTKQLGHAETSTTERIYIQRNNCVKVENMQTLSNAIGF